MRRIWRERDEVRQHRAPGFRVALTFDTEHPEFDADPSNTLRLLDVLAHEQAVATFFLQGQWASSRPSLARRIAEDGHLIGSHSQWHVPHTSLTESGLRDSVKRAEASITATTGVDPRPWFRCPYGQGIRERRVRRILGDLGYVNVAWDVEPYDFRPGIQPEHVAERAVSGSVAHGDGARVLLHNWPDATLAALPMILSGLSKAGARLVRLDSLPTPPGAPRAVTKHG
jgi:peptidoglycan/xylan/chitin deacetylase (PgdA/CDA1 family)